MKIFALLAVLTLGCSSQTPIQKLSHNPSPDESACLDIALSICMKAESCGWPEANSCWSTLAPACAEIKGITYNEVVQCVSALKAMDCAAQTPSACVSLGHR